MTITKAARSCPDACKSPEKCCNFGCQKVSHDKCSGPLCGLPEFGEHHPLCKLHLREALQDKAGEVREPGKVEIATAAYEIASALYFADNSDYVPAMQTALRCLAPDVEAGIAAGGPEASGWWHTASDRLAEARDGNKAHPAPVVPDGFALVPVSLLIDAERSVGDYLSGIGSSSYDRKVRENMQAAIAASQKKGGSAG